MLDGVLNNFWLYIRPDVINVFHKLSYTVENCSIFSAKHLAVFDGKKVLLTLPGGGVPIPTLHVPTLGLVIWLRIDMNGIFGYPNRYVRSTTAGVL